MIELVMPSFRITTEVFYSLYTFVHFNLLEMPGCHRRISGIRKEQFLSYFLLFHYKKAFVKWKYLNLKSSLQNGQCTFLRVQAYFLHKR